MIATILAAAGICFSIWLASLKLTSDLSARFMSLEKTLANLGEKLHEFKTEHEDLVDKTQDLHDRVIRLEIHVEKK